MPLPDEKQKHNNKRRCEKRKLKTDSGRAKKKLKADSGDALENGSVNCDKKKSTAGSQDPSQLEATLIHSDTEKLMTDSGGDGLEECVSSVYWKDLAEERRVALEEALVENQKLTERVETLEAENRDLEEMLADAKALAEMINTMTDETVDESGIGKDIDTTLNTSSETEPTE